MLRIGMTVPGARDMARAGDFWTRALAVSERRVAFASPAGVTPLDRRAGDRGISNSLPRR